MKTKTFVWLCLALFICSACERETIKPDDPTTFTNSSIVGIWACIASDNLTYDIFTGGTTIPTHRHMMYCGTLTSKAIQKYNM